MGILKRCNKQVILDGSIQIEDKNVICAKKI